MNKTIYSKLGLQLFANESCWLIIINKHLMLFIYLHRFY